MRTANLSRSPTVRVRRRRRSDAHNRKSRECAARADANRGCSDISTVRERVRLTRRVPATSLRCRTVAQPARAGTARVWKARPARYPDGALHRGTALQPAFEDGPKVFPSTRRSRVTGREVGAAVGRPPDAAAQSPESQRIRPIRQTSGRQRRDQRPTRKERDQWHLPRYQRDSSRR